MLDEALIRTYADFGITHENSSVYVNPNAENLKMKKMPILGDLHKHLQENPMTQRLAAIVSRFVTGSAQSFNQPTNVDLSNKYIVLDLSELKGKLLPVGMFIALDLMIRVSPSRSMVFLRAIYPSRSRLVPLILSVTMSRSATPQSNSALICRFRCWSREETRA